MGLVHGFAAARACPLLAIRVPSFISKDLKPLSHLSSPSSTWASPRSFAVHRPKTGHRVPRDNPQDLHVLVDVSQARAFDGAECIDPGLTSRGCSVTPGPYIVWYDTVQKQEPFQCLLDGYRVPVGVRLRSGMTVQENLDITRREDLFSHFPSIPRGHISQISRHAQGRGKSYS